jgi:hypothetical protein
VSDEFDPTTYRVCYCGCTEEEHWPSGGCRYCIECERFQYDEDSTVCALAEMKEFYKDLP